MRLLKYLPVLASLAFTVTAREEWSADKIHILNSNITYSGDGCLPIPNRPWQPTIYARWPTNAEASFLMYGVSGGMFAIRSGPDIPPAERHKSCEIVIPIEYQRGYQYEVVELAGSGPHRIPEEYLGLVYTRVSFKDHPAGNVTRAERIFRGPFDNMSNGEDNKHDMIGSNRARSPCGGGVKGNSTNWGALVINTDLLLIPKGREEKPMPAQMKVMGQYFVFLWHACNPNDGLAP